MAHAAHHFIVKRDFGPKLGWGYIGEDAAAFADCVEAILESFNGDDAREISLTTETVLVLEIDGATALNRTEDALAELFVDTTWRGPAGTVGSFLRVNYSGSEEAIQCGQAA